MAVAVGVREGGSDQMLFFVFIFGIGFGIGRARVCGPKVVYKV